VFRDFNLRIHYKKTNTKGLFTLGDGKRDVYFLYRSFLRPDDPVVHIASKKYFVRQGSATNGVKVYSNRPELTLTVNGASWGSRRNGEYRSGGHVVDNVFFWADPLHRGTNRVVVSDGAGHEDRSVIVFDGEGGRPPAPESGGLVRDVTSSNPANPAYHVDQPIQPQWPFYYGDSSNTFDEIPEAVRGASWIATRRQSEPQTRTEIAFSLDPEGKNIEIYVMCTDEGSSPAFLTGAGFTDTGITGLWRDDRRTLVPYRRYRKRPAGGERIRLGEAGLDYVILVKNLEHES
jgi:beta-galactosidase